jgi:hypothetical protein
MFLTAGSRGRAKQAILDRPKVAATDFFVLGGVSFCEMLNDMIHRFALRTREAQLCQFVFFASVATGTVIGGPIGDRSVAKR